MNTLETIANILVSVLQMQNQASLIDADSALLGAIPEFDSMAVINIITALEDNFGFVVEDDEIDASIFETVGSLVAFVESKL